MQHTEERTKTTKIEGQEKKKTQQQQRTTLEEKEDEEDRETDKEKEDREDIMEIGKIKATHHKDDDEDETRMGYKERKKERR